MRKLAFWLMLATIAAVMWSSLGTVGAVDSIGTDEVRIQARKLEDGKIEFGLQQRTDGGQWAERALPSGRFFPTDARVDRWLSSTPLTTVVRLDRPSRFTYTQGWSEYADNERIRFRTQREPGFDGANTHLVIDGRSDSREFPEARLIISCRHGNSQRPSELWMTAAAYRGDSSPIRPSDTAPVAALDESSPVAYYRIQPWRAAKAVGVNAGWIRFDQAESLLDRIVWRSSEEVVPPTLEIEANVSPGNRIKMSFWSEDINTGHWWALLGQLQQCEKDRFDSDVRITARKLENGEVEFALQQRTSTGWTEQLLPSRRRFPVNAPVGRWLSSSPLELATPDNFREQPRPMDGVVDGVTHYSFGGAELVPSVTLYGETDHTEHSLAEFTIGCEGTPFDGRLTMRAVLLSTTTSEWRPKDPYQLQYLSSDQWYTTNAYPVALGHARWPLKSDRRTVSPSSAHWYRSGTQFNPENPGVARQVIGQLQRGGELSLQFQFSDKDDVIATTLDVSSIFDTPIQEWLDWCIAWPYLEIRE